MNEEPTRSHRLRWGDLLTSLSSTQARYLSVIHAYWLLHHFGPAEADLQRTFQTSAATVHQMIVRLEKKGALTRIPGQPRSLRVAIPLDQIPTLF